MEYKNTMQAQKYLCTFDEILCQMSNKMLTAQMTNSITINFIKCMIPHHQAAIYMCENLLKYTNYYPLQEIARNIIRMQTTGIEQMKQVATTTEGFENSKQDVNCYLEKYFEITKNMICKMKNSSRSNNINLNFVNEMIPHHEGAISMCNNLLQYCIDPRLKNIANSIIQEQTRGVKELETIRKVL